MGQLWHHLKHCKQAIGSTNIIFLRPTDGWRFAGAAAQGRAVQWGASTSRANTCWLALTNGLQRKRARVALTAQRTDSRGKSARGVLYERPSCGREGDDRSPGCLRQGPRPRCWVPLIDQGFGTLDPETLESHSPVVYVHCGSFRQVR